MATDISHFGSIRISSRPIASVTFAAILDLTYRVMSVPDTHTHAHTHTHIHTHSFFVFEELEAVLGARLWGTRPVKK